MQLEDSELVEKAQNGDDFAEECLMERYKNFVRAKSQPYFIAGADKEDIIQEGMIGLYKAIRDYKPDKQASFRGFADLCITRQIITAIKTATRMKHQPLNTYVSLSRPVYDDESEKTLMDVLMGENESNPEELYINSEEYNAAAQHIQSVLSKLERQVLVLHLAGKSYQEIAARIDKPIKSIDNALQRAKNKLAGQLK